MQYGLFCDDEGARIVSDRLRPVVRPVVGAVVLGFAGQLVRPTAHRVDRSGAREAALCHDRGGARRAVRGEPRPAERGADALRLDLAPADLDRRLLGASARPHAVRPAVLPDRARPAAPAVRQRRRRPPGLVRALAPLLPHLPQRAPPRDRRAARRVEAQRRRPPLQPPHVRVRRRLARRAQRARARAVHAAALAARPRQGRVRARRRRAARPGEPRLAAVCQPAAAGRADDAAAGARGGGGGGGGEGVPPGGVLARASHSVHGGMPRNHSFHAAAAAPAAAAAARGGRPGGAPPSTPPRGAPGLRRSQGGFGSFSGAVRAGAARVANWTVHGGNAFSRETFSAGGRSEPRTPNTSAHGGRRLSGLFQRSPTTDRRAARSSSAEPQREGATSSQEARRRGGVAS